MKRFVFIIGAIMLLFTGCGKRQYEIPEKMADAVKTSGDEGKIMFRGMALEYEALKSGEELVIDNTSHPFICNVVPEITRENGVYQDILSCRFLFENYQCLVDAVYLYGLEVVGDSVLSVSEYEIERTNNADFYVCFNLKVEHDSSDFCFRFYSIDLYTQKADAESFVTYSPQGNTIILKDDMCGDVIYSMYCEYTLDEVLEVMEGYES